MEFNFRGWDAQMEQHMYHTPLKEVLWSGTSLGGCQGGPRILPRSVDTREAIQRELEKERIREEILAEEIERRRVLEAEVRREMAMEIALHGGGGFPSSFTPRPPLSHTNRLQPGMPPFAPVSFKEKFAGRCEIGRFQVVPHQRLPGSPVDGKKVVIDLGKPNGVTVSGAKGKPAGAGSSEWSCAVCKVSAPCERGFQEHLAGKKHQTQMAALKAKNTKKHDKTSKKQSGEIGLGVKSTTMETESSKSSKSVKTQAPPLMKKKSSKCDSKKEEDKKSELWFSCEMCNVGASSHEVMNAHIKGKKHLKNLVKLHQESAAAAPGTKKPHKAETEVGVEDKESTGRIQVADSESIGSVVGDI